MSNDSPQVTRVGAVNVDTNALANAALRGGRGSPIELNADGTITGPYATPEDETGRRDRMLRDALIGPADQLDINDYLPGGEK